MEKKIKIIGHSGLMGLGMVAFAHSMKGVNIVNQLPVEEKNEEYNFPDLISPIYIADRYAPGKHRAGNNSKRPKPRKKKK